MMSLSLAMAKSKKLPSEMRLDAMKHDGVGMDPPKVRFSNPCTVPNSSISRKKFRKMEEILAVAKYAVLDPADYSDVSCEECGSGDKPKELLLCDKCDKGFHMNCVRPIVVRIPIGSWLCPTCCGQRRVRRLSQKKIFDFFRIMKCSDSEDIYLSPQDSRKRRKRWAPPVFQKKRRRLLPFIPHEDHAQRLKEMSSLASALTALQIEFCDDLYYSPGSVPRSSNQAKFEIGGMQVLSKEDIETLEHCRAMSKRGLCAPLIVRFDACEGYTVEADSPIKDMTLITEYAGDVDSLENRKNDDCDSIMTLLLANDLSKCLVICPDKHGNIARFVNGINNHTSDGKKKQNCKCVRYDVNGEIRVLLVATRDIAKGEKLYYDYNGYEHAYPTQHFI